MKKYLVIILLLIAGASFAQPPRIDSMFVPGPDNDSIYIHGKFGSLPGRIFLDTSEIQVYTWTDTIITANLLPLFIKDKPSCGPVTVDVGGIISNPRTLSVGVIHANYFFGRDSSFNHSFNSDTYWRYDFHSFFLNHQEKTKLSVPTNHGNAIFDFMNGITTFYTGVSTVVKLSANYFLPQKGRYSPDFGNTYTVNFSITEYCTAPLDARLIYQTRTSVQSIGNSQLTLSCYPNPSSNELNISFTLPENENAWVMLYDLTGRIIRKENISNTSSLNWNISDIPNGSYILGLQSANNRLIQNIIVAR